MKLTTHKIDRDMKDLYKRTFGPYWFNPCSCGCTRSYGVGFQFYWFSIKLLFWS